MACFSTFTGAATCSCAGVPLLNSMNATNVNAQSWLLSINYEYHEINDLYSGSQQVNDETFRERVSNSIISQLDYGIDEHWSITGMISHISHKRQIGSSNNSKIHTSGLGDSLLLIKYTPVTMSLLSPWQLSLGFGIKFPTGANDVMRNGFIVSEDMQPGSGAYSSLAWFSSSYRFDQAGQLQAFISANYSDNRENDRQYQLGDETNASVGISYTMQENWGAVALLRYRTTSADQRAGNDIPNTGGEWLDFVPSIQYRFENNLAINLSGRIPVDKNLDGALQFTTSNAITLGISYVF